MSGLHAAGAWYASGTFWTGAGAVVAAVAAAAAVATTKVTRAVGFPRGRLYCWLRAAAPLLTVPAGIDDLEIRYGVGSLLASPYFLTIELTSRGRKDIPTEAFDHGQPLTLDVNSPVVKVIQVLSEPETLQPPKITFTGTELRVGPNLIGRQQKITIMVLTDGGQPLLSCRSPIRDVEIMERPGDSPDWMRAAALLAGWTVGVLLAFTAEGFSRQRSAGWAAVAAAGAAIAALSATEAWLSRQRQPAQRRRPRWLVRKRAS
jgi:hypothetical protein